MRFTVSIDLEGDALAGDGRAAELSRILADLANSVEGWNRWGLLDLQRDGWKLFDYNGNVVGTARIEGQP